MKWLSIVLGGALVVLILVFLQHNSQSNQQLMEARTRLQETSKDLDAARAEVTQVKTEMKKSFQELEGKVGTLITEKTAAQEKIDALAEDMKAVLQDLQTEKAGRKTLEAHNLELSNTLETVGGEMAALKQQNGQLEERYKNLEQAHAKTIEHLAAMREEYVTMTKDKEALEAKWNDLAALKSQIGTVKLELRKQRIEEWKRSDRIEAATGNHGFLMRSGEWTATESASGGSKFPLTEEIHREP